MIQNLHRKNLIVPLVGDFAGPKTLRAVGAYLKAHDATASVIYTSNVEQYLFQDFDNWKTYYTNIATLPLDSTSTFIRSAFNRGGYNPLPGSGMRSVQLIASVEALLKAFKAGRIMQYYDVLEMSRAPEL
jgi:hypothetical protein